MTFSGPLNTTALMVPFPIDSLCFSCLLLLLFCLLNMSLSVLNSYVKSPRRLGSFECFVLYYFSFASLLPSRRNVVLNLAAYDSPCLIFVTQEQSIKPMLYVVVFYQSCKNPLGSAMK